jgi:hypothetical protein
MVYILEDSGFVFGVEPGDFFVAPEPGHLFSGVNAGVPFDLFNGKIQGPVAVHVLKQFFVTYGIECVQMFVGVDTPGFFEEAVRHHLFYSPVDAFVQFFPVAGESYFQDAERAFFLVVGAESRVGFARCPAYFYGMDYAFVVFPVYPFVMSGVCVF